jgi:hypothetical protein
MLLSPLSLLLVSMQAGAPALAAQDPTLNPSQAFHTAPVSAPWLGTMSRNQGGQIFAGSIDSDDFNRPAIGSEWTQVGAGSFAISADTLISASGNDQMVRTGTTAAYEDQTVEFDLLPSPAGLSYTAAITGIGANQLFTKVQSNSGGVYDFIGFYQGFNGGGLGTYGGFVAITPVTGGHVRMYITNAGDTMNVDIDEANDGVYEYHYESSTIVSSFAGTLGTGTGIGGWAAQADNWELGDGPSGPALSVAGTCPGLNTFTITGSDPFGPIGIVYGPAGSFTVSGGACSGLALDIAVPTIAGIFAADAAGGLTFSATLPAGACGATVQAVDVNNCAPSNSEVL